MFIRQFTNSSWSAWSSFYTTAYKPTLSELGAAAASHTHTKSQITDFPTSLKNPTSIKIQLNGGTTEGTNQFTYNGSAAKNINITPSSIGASASGHTHSYLPLSGGTMTGAITLPGNPTSNLHAATKQYVDSQIAGSGSGDMLKSVYDTDNDGVVDSSEKIESEGKKTSTTNSTTVDSAANEIPKTGISMYEFYNTTNSPITYANVINVRGRQAGGAGQLALGWEGSSTTPNIFYRAHRDQGNVAWGPWEKIVYESDLPSIKKTITINGDSDKYYPIKISGYTNIKSASIPAKFCITRSYARKAPDNWNTATHRGSLQFISKIYVNGWSGENSFMEWELAEKYAVTFGGIQHSARGNNFVVWLRGGGAEYDLIGENPALSAAIYYETTDLTTDLGFSVSPRTYDQIPDDYPKFAKGGSAHWKYDGTGVQRNYLANVDLGGTPKAVTPSISDNSTRIATTAYVKSNLLTDGISTYTHSKSGTVHTLTGSGDNIRFVATADFTSGDTFKIGASAVTAKTIGGDSLWTGFFKNGAVVTCYKNGTTINFNGGGLPASELAKLTPENIKTGVSIIANGKTVTGTFTADGTAAAGDILAGKAAYVKGKKITGTIPTNPVEVSLGTPKATNAGLQYYFNDVNTYYTSGYYYSDNEDIVSAIKLTSDKLKSGEKVLGVTGSFTDDANATADDILLGKTAYAAGVKLTGRIPKAPSSTSATGSGNSGGQFYLTTQEGFYAEGTKLTKPSEEMGAAIGLTAGVLKTGTTVGGIRGTYTSDANAGSRDLRSGKTAYVGGQKISGNLIDLGYEPEGTGCVMWQNRLYSYFGDSSSSYIIARGVNIPQDKVANAIGLTAAKIASGNTILGIAGTYTGASGGYLFMGQRNNTQMYGFSFGTATYSGGIRIGTSGNYRLVMFGYNETNATGRMKVNGVDVFAYGLQTSKKYEVTKWLNAGDTVSISADNGANYALTGFVISI